MKLEDVNTAVNRTVRPEDDSVHYGIEEYWTVPLDGYGDCEDYVLAKRKMLMLLGVPEPARYFGGLDAPHGAPCRTDRGDGWRRLCAGQYAGRYPAPAARTDFTWGGAPGPLKPHRLGRLELIPAGGCVSRHGIVIQINLPGLCIL